MISAKMIKIIEPFVYNSLNSAATNFIVKNYISPPFSYFTTSASFSNEDIEDEKILDKMQPSILIRWFGIFFDTHMNITDITGNATNKKLEELTPNQRTEFEYLKELHNIYRTIVSDYRQYEYQKQYNKSLWLFKSYRKKNSNDTAKKILMDIHLLQEGINLYPKINDKNT